VAIPRSEGTLKEKAAKALAEALVENLELAGLSAKEVIEATLAIEIPTGYEGFTRIGYKAAFMERLKALPEPKNNELSQALAALTALKSAPHKMRALFKQRLKELPHGAGGPPRKVKVEEERVVCAEILALRSEYDTRDAIRQVARKWGVSERTIYRIWGKYHPKKKRRATS
jgi:hypothetical protein